MRIIVAILGIGVCLFLMQAAGRIGLSRLLSNYALIANSIPAADEAIRLSPSDPDTHRTRAVVLNRLQLPAEALKSLETAVSLRHRDDYLWLDIGSAREELGDPEGALAAFDQAVRWAPYYGHTHWQRGNLLLRMGRTNEAFAELRKAAAVNQNYLPNLIDLAWGIAREDLKTTESLIDIKQDRERLALILFLAKRGKGKETLDQMGLLPTPLPVEIKNEVARLLFEAKSFRESFALWNGTTEGGALIFNGGFEQPLELHNASFGGWMLSDQQTKNKLAIDLSQKLSGTRSLQIVFGGEWNPGTPLLSQTILVEPAKTYPISFNVKTKDLATGGPLTITVNDAVNNQLLGKSENFPATDSWLTLNFEFTTLETSEAAVIRLQRSNCDSSPCPIFGTLWLDEFSIGPWKHVASER